MRRLYAFLLLLVGIGAISSELALAQTPTYAPSDYIVRKIDQKDAQGLGSGSNWQELSGGTTVTGTYIGQYQGQMGAYTSIAYQMPFNFRYLNNQLTTTNNFFVDDCGSIILSPTWNPN